MKYAILCLVFALISVTVYAQVVVHRLCVSVTAGGVTETGPVNFSHIDRLDESHYIVRTEFITSDLEQAQHQTVYVIAQGTADVHAEMR